MQEKGEGMKKLIILLLAVGVIGSMIFTGCAQPAGLEARVQALEDVNAIKELKCMYAYYADEGNVDGILSLYVDDAVCDFGPFGVHEGKEQIRTLFTGLLEGSSFTMHEMHNHVVTVTGDTATGEAYFEIPATMEPGHMAMWMGGKYVDDYVKVGGEWKFKKVTILWYYITPYEEGWAETPFPP
jgi:ketosteroid isomerase-like protein